MWNSQFLLIRAFSYQYEPHLSCALKYIYSQQLFTSWSFFFWILFRRVDNLYMSWDHGLNIFLLVLALVTCSYTTHIESPSDSSENELIKHKNSNQ